MTSWQEVSGTMRKNGQEMYNIRVNLICVLNTVEVSFLSVFIFCIHRDTPIGTGMQ